MVVASDGDPKALDLLKGNLELNRGTHDAIPEGPKDPSVSACSNSTPAAAVDSGFEGGREVTRAFAVERIKPCLLSWSLGHPDQGAEFPPAEELSAGIVPSVGLSGLGTRTWGNAALPQAEGRLVGTAGEEDAAVHEAGSTGRGDKEERGRGGAHGEVGALGDTGKGSGQKEGEGGVGVDWGSETKFDVILGADVVYNRAAVPALFATARALLKPSPPPSAIHSSTTQYCPGGECTVGEPPFVLLCHVTRRVSERDIVECAATQGFRLREHLSPSGTRRGYCSFCERDNLLRNGTGVQDPLPCEARYNEDLAHVGPAPAVTYDGVDTCMGSSPEASSSPVCQGQSCVQVALTLALEQANGSTSQPPFRLLKFCLE